MWLPIEPQSFADSSNGNNAWAAAWAKIKLLFRRVSCKVRAIMVELRRLWYKLLRWMEENPWTALLIAVGIVITILLLALSAMLPAAGFTATGPAIGSFAAWWQSAYGTGAIFSMLQSAAMGGYGAGALGGLAAASGIITGAGVAAVAWGGKVWKIFKGEKEQEPDEKEKSE